MLSSPPPSSKDVLFFSLSPRLPGRGTLPFVSEGTLSLSFPLLFSCSLIHKAQRARERVREKSFTWTRKATGRNWLQRGRETEREGEKRRDNETEKGDVSAYLCSHVLCSFPLAAV